MMRVDCTYTKGCICIVVLMGMAELQRLTNLVNPARDTVSPTLEIRRKKSTSPCMPSFPSLMKYLKILSQNGTVFASCICGFPKVGLTSTGLTKKNRRPTWQLSSFSSTMGESQIMHVKPKREFEYISGVECLEHYRPGGYHPVKLGDSLCKGRYTILHKLGYGATSTIWLAADRDAEQLVALKIKTAESAHNSTEINLLSKLAGETFVQRLLDVFSLAGPNGTHQCLVLEAAQCSIHIAKELSGHQLLNLSIARSIIAGLILGVQRLHSIGIVHGGQLYSKI